MDYPVRGISIAIIIIFGIATVRGHQAAHDTFAGDSETNEDNCQIWKLNTLEEYYKNLSQITNELIISKADLQQCKTIVAESEKYCEFKLQSTEIKIERKCNADREAVMDRHEQKLNFLRNELKQDCKEEKIKLQNEYDRNMAFFEKSKSEIEKQFEKMKDDLIYCRLADSRKGPLDHLYGLFQSLFDFFLGAPTRLGIGQYQ